MPSFRDAPPCDGASPAQPGSSDRPPAAGGRTAVLLANHGPVVSGSSLEAAVYAAEELEETAKLFLLLRDVPTRPLDAAQVDELKTAFGLDI